MSQCANLTYHQKKQRRDTKQSKRLYKNLSEEEKNKKREYGKNRYCNMSEEKKQRFKKYQKKCRYAKKSLNIIMNKILFSCDLIVYAVI